MEKASNPWKAYEIENEFPKRDAMFPASTGRDGGERERERERERRPADLRNSEDFESQEEKTATSFESVHSDSKEVSLRILRCRLLSVAISLSSKQPACLPACLPFLHSVTHSFINSFGSTVSLWLRPPIRPSVSSQTGSPTSGYVQLRRDDDAFR